MFCVTILLSTVRRSNGDVITTGNDIAVNTDKHYNRVGSLKYVAVMIILHY